MHTKTVLILSDDVEFAHTVMGRWQVERSVPAFILMRGETWSGNHAAEYGLAIVGRIHGPRQAAILDTLESAATPCIYLPPEGTNLAALRAEHSRLVILGRHDGWVDALVLVGGEALLRGDAQARALHAEREAALCRRESALGRYMLEMRHPFNNALTSVLGNAELILLDPGALAAPVRDQVETIQKMSLRLLEIMKRFTSLDSEMKYAESKSGNSQPAPAPALDPRVAAAVAAAKGTTVH
ncbi:MAG: hypothetical protein ACRD2R_05785 [Terriglobales bacterium]